MSITYQSRFNGTIIVTEDSRRYRLSNTNFINAGRDGEVFKLDGHLAAKIYYNNPINPVLWEKLVTLCAQKDAFHELVVSPLQMVRLEEQTSRQAAGFVMKYLPNAKPLSLMRWKSSVKKEEGFIFDQTAASFIYDLSEALETLHANRVFMCDLKPDNILVSNLRPYLIDFDSCSMPNYPGETFTIPYLDPRIRDGVPNAVGSNQAFSALTDWWALAVIVFELFIGVLPWSGIHPKYRKEPLVNRSFIYSVVILDPMVKIPKLGVRAPSWLESKPRLMNYFRRVFSSDPAGRIPPVEVLNVYFPREYYMERTKPAISLMDRVVQDDRDSQFFQRFWAHLIEKARIQAAEREKARIRLLDMMYSLE